MTTGTWSNREATNFLTPESFSALIGKMRDLKPIPPPMKIICSPHLGTTISVRFPRSKKRRILRKWAKRPENSRFIPDPNIYFMQDLGTIVVHPRRYAEIATMRLAEHPRP